MSLASAVFQSEAAIADSADATSGGMDVCVDDWAFVAEGAERGEEDEFCANTTVENETINAREALIEERTTDNLNP